MIRVRPWLWLSAPLAHKLSLHAVKALGMVVRSDPPQWQPLEWRGLHFPNRLGIAGGVDKDAEGVRAWWALGAGFVEIGTVTPLPQPGNTPPVVDRDVSHRALWNRMGFPSKGAEKVKAQLEKISGARLTPVFANIGKNATTPLENAHQDYIHLLEKLSGTVDGFVINISSPNTKGLRELLKPERLREFLKPILAARPNKNEPILLKLSPDMEDEETARVLEISHELGIDGWILTNTSQNIRDELSFPKEGGVSGEPLAAKSKEMLQRTLRILGPKRQGKLVISVGGILTADDVRERLQMGADLVQVYSALIFEGPLFFRKVARGQHARG